MHARTWARTPRRPPARMMLNVLSGVAQFEQEMILERRRENRAKAMAEGVDQGRKPIIRACSEEIGALAEQGLRMGAIAPKLDIGRGARAEPGRSRRVETHERAQRYTGEADSERALTSA
ncbi:MULTISPECIES: recombinase family protein [unclassified Methylobacterium]|uniref:recombinase family protein n=1 Tax=unclassified Methylobacterium TaxID=2615210 RepID=UPI0036FA0541